MRPHWVKATLKVLGPTLQMRNHGSVISYGSDCSGLDAPFWGLKLLLAGLEAELTECQTSHSSSLKKYNILY